MRETQECLPIAPATRRCDAGLKHREISYSGDHRATTIELNMPSLQLLLLTAMISGASAGVGLPGLAGEQQGHPVQVLAVNNGQELLVEIEGQGRTIRLSCLQAPRPKQQPWAKQATSTLVSVAPTGTPLTFELRARDVYGRLVGKLEHNGQDIAEPLLRQGRVFAYDGLVGRCDDLPYQRWQEEARAKRLGVWSVQGGITRPWDQREQTAAGDRLAP